MEIKENTDKPSCKGKIFKASRNYFYDKGRLVNSVEFRLLKRKSCSGCKKCGWIEEYLREEVNCKYPILGLEEVRPGRLYTIRMCNISTDWETGYVEDFELEVIEVE